MTSVTPRSAMTSVTDTLLVSLSLTAQGARRATGVVNESAGPTLSKPILMFVNDNLVQSNAQFLSRHIDGREHVLINNFWRHPELLTEDIQDGITPNETDQVIATALGLRQRMPGRCGRFRQPNRCVPQSHLRRATLQLGVAIPSVMFRFKEQRLSMQVLSSMHQHAAQKTPSVMVIELFHHAVTPRLGDRNKPKLYFVSQAKTNQTAQSARMTMTTIENQFIVYLLMPWYSQTPPVRPDSLDRRLRGFAENRRHRTATGCQINTVQAVKAQRAAQVTGTHVIALMHLVDLLTNQLRITLALRLITSGAAVCQALAAHYPTDCPQAWQRRYLHRFQFPTDRLSATKQSLVVQMQTRQLDRFDYFPRQLPRIAMRPSGLIYLPMACFAAALIALNPFVDPRAPITKFLGDRRYRFALQVRLNRMLSVPLRLLLLHAFLQQEKGPDDETTPFQPIDKLRFQRTVSDVVAHRRVSNVMTLVI